MPFLIRWNVDLAYSETWSSSLGRVQTNNNFLKYFRVKHLMNPEISSFEFVAPQHNSNMYTFFLKTYQ